MHTSPLAHAPHSCCTLLPARVLLPQAPHLPLLLPAATPGNVAMLLSGGDDAEAWKVGRDQGWLGLLCLHYLPSELARQPESWRGVAAHHHVNMLHANKPRPAQTEFGASQVVLRRTLASPVPHFLAKIDAVIM